MWVFLLYYFVGESPKILSEPEPFTASMVTKSSIPELLAALKTENCWLRWQTEMEARGKEQKGCWVDEEVKEKFASKLLRNTSQTRC